MQSVQYALIQVSVHRICRQSCTMLNSALDATVFQRQTLRCGFNELPSPRGLVKENPSTSSLTRRLGKIPCQQLLARGHSEALATQAFPQGTSQMVTFYQSKQLRRSGESDHKVNVLVFSKLIPEVTSQPFCHFLPFRNGSSPHREGTTQCLL